MKYIKTFNESVYQNQFDNELSKFCKEYLVYIIDRNFEVHVQKDRKGNTKIEIYKKSKTNPYTNFTWNEVKYDFIPFFQILDTKYELKSDFVNAFNEINLPSFQKNLEYPDNVVVEFSTPFSKESPNYFYSRKQILSGRCGPGNRSISSIIILVGDKKKYN